VAPTWVPKENTETGLVRYDATCRAIDAAYAVDRCLGGKRWCYRGFWNPGRLSLMDLGTSRPNGTKSHVLREAGISREEASRWERLSEVPEDQFEGALATKSVRDLIDKPSPVSDDALLFIGTMREASGLAMDRLQLSRGGRPRYSTEMSSLRFSESVLRGLPPLRKGGVRRVMDHGRLPAGFQGVPPW
jgi:hypothetical protein